jgi:hypothetical protein
MIPQRNLQRLNELYEELKANGSLAVDYSCLGSDDPLPSNAVDEGVLTERFSGCLLGGAVGDALGHPLEANSPGCEWVENYQLWHGWRSGPKGTITDDTQFSMWLLQSLIANGGSSLAIWCNGSRLRKSEGSATQPERSEERQGFREALV